MELEARKEAKGGGSIASARSSTCTHSCCWAQNAKFQVSTTKTEPFVSAFSFARIGIHLLVVWQKRRTIIINK